MNTDAQPTSPEESTALENIGTAIGSAITGVSIPEPIQRNAIKAFGRLCAALIEIPAAVLEGIAAEKRAESHARVDERPVPKSTRPSEIRSSTATDSAVRTGWLYGFGISRTP